MESENVVLVSRQPYPLGQDHRFRALTSLSFLLGGLCAKRYFLAAPLGHTEYSGDDPKGKSLLPGMPYRLPASLLGLRRRPQQRG